MNYTFATVFAKNQAAAQEIVGDGYFTTKVKNLEDDSIWYVSSGAWDNEPLMQIVNANIQKIVRFPDGQMEGFELFVDEVESGE
jgi:hypothetical protein